MSGEEHLSEATLAAAVEGNLTPWERRTVLGHLAGCQHCTEELAALHRMLNEANLLPPVPLRHPLEEALSWLRRIAPFPIWLWHSILFALTPFAWIVLINGPAVVHFNVPYTLSVWPAAILMTTHFIWLQARLRQLMLGLWRSGVPVEEVNAFEQRYLGILQGRGVGSGWFFLAVAFVTTLVNWMLLPAAPFWESLKQFTLGFYALTITMAMYWAWFWGGRLWWGLRRLWQTYPALASQPITGRVQRLAAGWVLVSASSMIWHLFLGVRVPEIRLSMQAWGILVFVVLLMSWIGYAAFELHLVLDLGERRETWQPALRLTVTLALVVLILPIIRA